MATTTSRTPQQIRSDSLFPRSPTTLVSPITPVEPMPKADSLTRQRISVIPTLSHLLSVGNGRVLSLAADESHVYAGCQGNDNEITVFCRSSLQPLFRLVGHAGSVLALLVVKEKGWLVSSSAAGDVRIWSTTTFELLYIIHPCDDTSGDIYCLAWDDREGGTLYFGAQNTSIEWVNFKRLPGKAREGSEATLKCPSPGPTFARLRSDVPSPAPSVRSGRYKPHSFFDSPPLDVRSGSGTSTPRTPAFAQPVPMHGVPPAEILHRLRDTGRRASSSSLNTVDKGDSAAVEDETTAKPNGRSPSPVVEFELDVDSTVFYAHYGYVYALEMVKRPDGTRWLASGSGDSDVKVWECAPGGGLSFLKEFDGLAGAVLSLASRDSLLYAGLQDGEIDVWDLETGSRIRTIEAHDADVMAMIVLGCDVYTGAADGDVRCIDDAFDCTASFKAHDDPVLAMAIVPSPSGHAYDLITAGNDSFLKIWAISTARPPVHDIEVDMDIGTSGDVMLYALKKLVSLPTVSDEAHRESCRQGAHLLKNILSQLGARAEILPGDQGRNPLVLATFTGRDTGKPRKRVLFYGHYDVQPVGEKDWESDPFTLTGRDGYLYGRGVTDNKGPIMAVACAAAELQRRRELDVDLVMLIEGEEEAGSRGFAAAVRRNRNLIGDIDVVLLANSTWINEENPCVVYGMRGVVYANVAVFSEGDDAHNGVEGGLVAEPMMDLVRLLGSLADAQGVKLPGFYESVRAQTPAELELLTSVSNASGRSLDDLMRVWRQPTFSIANISTSGSANKTVIPRRVSADIAMRIVPDQDLDTIVASLVDFCQETFAAQRSTNALDVKVTHAASWWLASLDNPYFRALEDAVQDVWGVAPLKIREGGTVPTMSWLEREFAAPCVHLPLGQSSDAGHLANERMRLLNLNNGRRVVESYLMRLAKI